MLGGSDKNSVMLVQLVVSHTKLSFITSLLCINEVKVYFIPLFHGCLVNSIQLSQLTIVQFFKSEAATTVRPKIMSCFTQYLKITQKSIQFITNTLLLTHV